MNSKMDIIRNWLYTNKIFFKTIDAVDLTVFYKLYDYSVYRNYLILLFINTFTELMPIIYYN